MVFEFMRLFGNYHDTYDLRGIRPTNWLEI